MNAFHSLWTKPANGREPETFELLTMVLSALKWREKNGSICLVTDSAGFEYIKEKGLLGCWNSVLKDLDNIPREVDCKRFWAAGKIYALKAFETPVVSVDTDFIVWESLGLENIRSELCAIHRESLNRNVYPDVPEFTMYDDGFSWEVLPLNAAFLYFGNAKLKDEYVRYAESVMTTCNWGDTLQPMVFAEQRILAMTAEKLGIVPHVFSSLEKLNSGSDERFTHLWGFKNQLKQNEALKNEFTEKLRNRIKTDFPDINI